LILIETLLVFRPRFWCKQWEPFRIYRGGFAGPHPTSKWDLIFLKDKRVSPLVKGFSNTRVVSVHHPKRSVYLLRCGMFDRVV